MIDRPGDERDEGEDAPLYDDNAYEAEEQLTLADEDEHLPWLESDDEYEEPGFDTRLILFVALAIALLAAILLAGWWYFSDRPDPEMVPDGSTIEAPEEPYRTRPDDPGGREVEGTGDVSFEVGEGVGSAGQIAGDEPQASASASGSEAAAGTGVGVQIGAFSSEASARNGWNQLRGRFPALQDHQYRILEGSADSGTIYRLQAIAADGSAADQLCRTIRSSGGDCQVKR